MELPRYKISLPNDTFNKIESIFNEQAWIKNRKEALFSIFNELNTEEQFNLIIDLLNRFINIDEEEEDKAFIKICNYIKNEWKLVHHKTFIVALHDTDNPSSAQSIIYCIKNYFEKKWQENLIVNKKPALEKLNKDKKIENIVFINDFIGSGTQFEEHIKYFVCELNKINRTDIKIYLVSLCIMNQALEKIKFIEGYTVTHYAYHYMQKGISDFSDIQKYTQIMLEIEKDIFEGDFLEKYSFGYGKSEALFRYGNKNAPNNNFPIFWSSKNKKNTLLKRV